jgi:predicted GIY-YIG superfamily endonuclease
VFVVYILKCVDHSLYSLYVGHTADLEARLKRHAGGHGAFVTRKSSPAACVYREEFPTRLEAIARERQLKRWTRRKKEALIAGDLRLLKRL